MVEPKISDETRNWFQKEFAARDVDNSGTLNREELMDCMQCLGYDFDNKGAEELKKLFDVNLDGKIQIKEVLDNIDVIEVHRLKGEDMKQAFAKFDINGDGCISLSEMLRVLTYNDFMDVDSARKLLTKFADKYDENNDGKFQYNEFVRMYEDSRYPFARGKSFESPADQ